MDNRLIDIVPGHQRKQAYAVFAALGVLIGAIQVGFGAAQAGQPVWLTVALAVYAFLGGAIGATANANVVESEQ